MIRDNLSLCTVRFIKPYRDSVQMHWILGKVYLKWTIGARQCTIKIKPSHKREDTHKKRFFLVIGPLRGRGKSDKTPLANKQKQKHFFSII